MSDKENTNDQVDNETNEVKIKPTKQIQVIELEYNGKQCIFDISVIKEPIKKDEVSRSLRDYKVETSKEYIDIPISDFQIIQGTLENFISALYQPPERSVEIKSTSIKELSCIVYYRNNEWKAQLKFQDRFLPHPFPIVSSKKEIYESDSNLEKKMTEHLLDCELTKDIIRNKIGARKIIHEIQAAACKKIDEIINLKINLEPIKEKPKELTKEEKATEKKNRILNEYGEAVFIKAMDLIREGKAQKFVIQEHCSTYGGIGDRISWALSCVFASINILSSNTGEHIKISGPSGKGKSTIVKNYLELVPSYLWIMTSPSGKNLFYNTNLHAGMVIVIDEFSNEETELIRSIKLISSHFQNQTTLDTVISFEAETKIVPPRIAFVLMSVLPLDSAELIQRCITVDVPSNIPYLENINKKQKEREGKLPTKDNKPSFNTQVCRCIYSILNSFSYDIRVPFAEVIEWNDIDHTRNWELFADLIRCSAYYNILNREFFHKEDNETIGAFLATYEDYENAIEIYDKLADNNVTKLTDNELKIINALKDASKKDVFIKLERDTEEALKNIKEDSCVDVDLEDITTYGELSITGLSHATGITEVTIRNLLHGVKKNGGLLERVYGLHSKMLTIQTPYKKSTRNTHKEIVWYDGPDNIISSVPIIPRDKCDAVTEKFKKEWLLKWKNEDEKWNVPT